MTSPRAGRPGAASLALLLIVLITAGWWTLALWPAGAVEPEWLVRTRAACFGSAPGGLPDAGGWILLVGQPLGMLLVLLAVWGDALRRELREVLASPRWRPTAGVLTLATLAGMFLMGLRLVSATGLGRSAPGPAPPPGALTPAGRDASSIMLTDQSGRRDGIAGEAGGTVLVTFAFGHCSTVCPTLVSDLLAARAAARRPDVPLVVITLDPWRDTPDRLAGLARQWRLAPGDRVLSGSIEEVDRALDLLGVSRRRAERTGTIDHIGTVLALDARGRVTWRLTGGWGRARELLGAVPPPARGPDGPAP